VSAFALRVRSRAQLGEKGRATATEESEIAIEIVCTSLPGEECNGEGPYIRAFSAMTSALRSLVLESSVWCFSPYSGCEATRTVLSGQLR